MKHANDTFKLNEKVCFIDDFMPDHIMTVSGFEHPTGVLLDNGRRFSIMEMLRLAEDDEVAANKRLHHHSATDN